MMSDLPMYPPIRFEDKFEQWTLTFTEDAVQMTKSKKAAGVGPTLLYEQTILGRQIRNIRSCHHMIQSPGGTIYTMLRLIVSLNHHAIGDPREADSTYGQPVGITYIDYGCENHEMHRERREFHNGKKIPTGDRRQICIFQDYIISQLPEEERGCSGTDYWRSKEEDDMILENFNKMVSSLRSWSHTD